MKKGKLFQVALMMLPMMLLTLWSFGQNINLQGTVVDDSGSPIPGVSVAVQETTIGTVTDFDGKFSLEVPQGSKVLVFSFVGMLAQEVEIGSQTTFNITMKPDVVGLDEVVVVGYGTIKKSDISGSVASVSTEEMMRKAPTNVAQGLKGAAAGVMVISQDGAPDGNAAVRIRGVATINGIALPLYVVDGVQVGTNANFLNPADIESMEVLKDASATAIYGARGANGVIMITTKHGTKGKARIEFSANFGAQTLPYTLDVQDADGYAKSIRSARASDGGVPVLSIWDAQYDGKRKTIDWQKEMTQVALKQQYNLSASGGTEKTQANFSLGYLDNEGLVVNSYYERLTARANVKVNVADFIEVGGDVNFVHTESMGSNSALGNNVNLSSLRDMAFITPTMDYISDGTNNIPEGTYVSPNVVNPDGTYGVYYQTSVANEVGKGYDNPYARQMELDNPSKSNRVFASAYINLDLYKGLSFRSIASYNFTSNDGYSWTPLRYRYNNGESIPLYGVDMTEEFSLNASQGNDLAIESYFTYNYKTDMHNFTLMAGNSVSKSYGQWLNVSAKDFPASNIRDIGYTNNLDSKTAGGGFNLQTRYISYYGRAMYSLKDRYIVTATMRRDGSSNFGAGNRWGSFPSAALAWRISEESFMDAVPTISNLKLRLGWGRTGNAGGATDLMVDQLSSANNLYHFYGSSSSSQASSAANGFAQQSVIDTNLKWETNEQVNLGLDLGLYDNKLNITADYFQRTAKDLLIYQTMRPSTGFTTVYTNFGEIQNKGFEFSVNYNTNIGRDWQVGATLTGSSLKNEVIECGADIFNTNDGTTNDGSNVGAVGGGLHWDNHSICREGYAVGSFYGYRVEGIFSNQSEIDQLNAAAVAKGFDYYQEAQTQPGDFKYMDINNDGQISEEDMDVLGNGFPKLNYGLMLDATYKNWDFSVYMYGVMGQDILSYSAMKLTTMTPSDDCVSNILADVVADAWSPNNTDGAYPRLSITDLNLNTRASDAWMKKGDFLKINNIQIGYSLPSNIAKSLKMSGARVYASVQNLATISSYNKYGDPEVGQGSVLYTGLDTGRYPTPRTYTFGVNIKF
ncbi:TonB-dependent receptor [Draconibacterium orientale]|uniref:SusC/RagA family TonB-linked outer membrane protein n=1 Tax=Draconibacterium orientale TaxID=1168034 RepID=UPI0029C0495F|nr:TonB-dependent receptor [Draconibacterium orientale]